MNMNKNEWETFNTPKIKIAYLRHYTPTMTINSGIRVRIKCHQPIKRKEKTLQDELCSNWESIDSFGVYFKDSTCHADDCEKFYDDPWSWIDKSWRYEPLHPLRNERYTVNNRSLDDEKGFILKHGNFERFAPIGVTWNDSYCRRITDSVTSGCFVKRDLSTIINFNLQKNNCSGRDLRNYSDWKGF